MLQLLTRENITFVLSLIGSVGTIAGWFYTILTQRVKLDIDCCWFRDAEKGPMFYLLFSNNSRLTVSITHIAIKIGDKYYPCKSIPDIALRCTANAKSPNPIITDYFLLQMPVTLSGLSSNSGYVFFPVPKESAEPLSSTVTLQIGTNRNKTFEKIFSLNDIHSDTDTLQQ